MILSQPDDLSFFLQDLQIAETYAKNAERDGHFASLPPNYQEIIVERWKCLRRFNKSIADLEHQRQIMGMTLPVPVATIIGEINARK